MQSSLAIDSKNITWYREIKHNKWLGYGGERERLLNGIILTSLSRNFFTDLRKASVDMPKPRFTTSMSQSANVFFSSFFRSGKGVRDHHWCLWIYEAGVILIVIRLGSNSYLKDRGLNSYRAYPFLQLLGYIIMFFSIFSVKTYRLY